MTVPASSIDLLWQPGVDEKYFNAARSALERATAALGISDRLPIVTIGTHADIEKMVVAARMIAVAIGQPEKVHVLVLNLWLSARRWRPQGWSGFPLLVVNESLTDSAGKWFFDAVANNCICATVSTDRFLRNTPFKDPVGVFTTTVMHELGHVLGTPNYTRDRAITMTYGAHCTNACIMQQQEDADNAHEARVLSRARITRPYCARCIKDVQHFLDGYLVT